MKTPLNFYQVRGLSDRLSATYEWVCAHWKVCLRNLLPVSIVFIVLVTLFQQQMFGLSIAAKGGMVSFGVKYWLFFAGYMILLLLFQLYLGAMSGALLKRSADGKLARETSWGDLKGLFFSIAGRLFVQMCILSLGLMVVSVAAIMLGGWATLPGQSVFVRIVVACVLMVILAGIIALLPSLSLMQSPLYLEGTSAWGSIRRGFWMGFRHWGSTFVTLFIGVVITLPVSYIVSMPYIAYLIVGGDLGGWMSGLFFALIYLVSSLLILLMVVFMGFQYGAISGKDGDARGASI